MRISLLFLIAALFAVAASAPARAATAAVCGPFTVAFYELGRLYHRDGGTDGEGIDKDVIDALQARSRCEFKRVLESRVRIWQQLAEGSLDLSVSGIASPEREQFAEFVPYFQARNFALMRRELARQLPTPQAFLADRTRRVVVVKAFRHGPVYDTLIAQLREQGRVTDAADFSTALRLFQAGRADLLLALPTAWTSALQKQEVTGQLAVLDWSPQDRIVHGLVLSRGRIPEADRQRLRLAMESLIVDGSIEAIFRRHVGERLTREMRVELPPPAAGPRPGPAGGMQGRHSRT